MASKVSMPNWYVFTGAQCSGKTTLINFLRKEPMVENVLHEAARAIIKRNEDLGIPMAETTSDPIVFQEAVNAEKLKMEEDADKGKLTLIDRGIQDLILYMRFRGMDTTHFNHISYNRYRTAFFLEMLPWETDGVRERDVKIRGAMDALLPIVYENTGHEVIRIPAVSVEERAEIVLSHLRRE